MTVLNNSDISALVVPLPLAHSQTSSIIDQSFIFYFTSTALKVAFGKLIAIILFTNRDFNNPAFFQLFMPAYYFVSSDVIC